MDLIIEREDKMNKEEYAMLHYLLAKLKYSLYELMKEYNSHRLKNKYIDLIHKIECIEKAYVNND